MDYVEFINYKLTKSKTGTYTVGSKTTVRIYSAVGSVAKLLPFTTIITLGEEDVYYELRNANNEVVYITDDKGVSTVYSTK